MINLVMKNCQRIKVKSSEFENCCVQTSRRCVNDNKCSLELFERKGQTDIRMIIVGERGGKGGGGSCSVYSVVEGAYVRKRRGGG